MRAALLLLLPAAALAARALPDSEDLGLTAAFPAAAIVTLRGARQGVHENRGLGGVPVSPPPVPAAPTMAPTQARRVRREWRSLSLQVRLQVASAMWTLKNMTTQAGRAKYGPNFNNHDEMLMLHACAVFDPRCDSGHFGPQFMTFHRAFLLKYERALLAVDPAIGALPYWNLAFDSFNGAYRNDPTKYIYTSNFFGDYWTTSPSYAVTNGLFAHWPIAVYTSAKFGKTSWLAANNTCIKNEWFSPKPCNSKNSKKKSASTTRYLRNHQDCTPTLARFPNDSSSLNSQVKNGLGGSYEIVYSAEDFKACHNPSNIKSWMDWQNCIEFATLSCGNTSDLIPAVHPPSAKYPATVNKTCPYPGSNLMGSFVSNGVVSLVNFFHSMAHLKNGRDLLDVATSPNDPGSFTGHHSNVDRNNMIWQASTKTTLEASYWGFPRTLNDVAAVGQSPITISGPYSLYDLGVCANKTSSFPNYYPGSSMWLPGSTLDEVVNQGFYFTHLFDCNADAVDAQGHKIRCSGEPGGYTHREILYWTAPERAPYTYDDMVG